MTVDSGQATELRCANHPDTVTHLRCSRCGKPICVRCVIQTPVGGRCRECAQLRKDPILVVGTQRYIRAALYGSTAAVIGGLFWAQMGSAFGLSWLLMILLGYAVGEAVSRGADRKISRGLVVMAGGLTVLSVVIGRALPLWTRMPSSLPLDDRVTVALEFAVGGLFTNLFGLLFLVLAVVIATNRVR
ncbi:MAG: B-box zinc finger protein [Chloroflexota bacterium]